MANFKDSRSNILISLLDSLEAEFSSLQGLLSLMDTRFWHYPHHTQKLLLREELFWLISEPDRLYFVAIKILAFYCKQETYTKTKGKHWSCGFLTDEFFSYFLLNFLCKYNEHREIYQFWCFAISILWLFYYYYDLFSGLI